MTVRRSVTTRERAYDVMEDARGLEGRVGGRRERGGGERERER